MVSCSTRPAAARRLVLKAVPMTFAVYSRRKFLRRSALLGAGVCAVRLPAAEVDEAFDVCVYVGNASGADGGLRGPRRRAPRLSWSSRADGWAA
jgi:hypothetical protein